MSHCPADPLERALVGQDSWFLQQTQKQRVKVSGGGRGGNLGGVLGGAQPSGLLTVAAPPSPSAPPGCSRNHRSSRPWR